MVMPLVLLPGMMCDARLFLPQIVAFSGHRAVMVAPLAHADTVEALAEDVLRNAPAEFALAGLSMGGIVAMEIVRQCPERVHRLALLDTNPLGERPEVAANRDRQMAKVAQGGLLAVMRDEMKPNYLADGPGRTGILDLCMEMAEALGAEVFARQSRALQCRPDQTDTLRRYEGPTLILCGRSDRLCPVERHEMMKDLMPQARLSVIDGAGHLPTLEQPDRTTEELARWLG